MDSLMELSSGFHLCNSDPPSMAVGEELTGSEQRETESEQRVTESEQRLTGRGNVSKVTDVEEPGVEDSRLLEATSSASLSLLHFLSIAPQPN